MKEYDELLAENARLRQKLSPLEDKEFTAKLAVALGKVDLSQYKRGFRGQDHVVVKPGELFFQAFGVEPNLRDVTNMGRSLQAMCWERSAKAGQILYVMPWTEYLETQQ